jgi:hypothetical protein
MDDASTNLSRDTATDATLVHPDTGLSVQHKIDGVILEQMRELAAEYMGIDSQQLSEMSQEQLQQALAKAGVNVDILEELRKLTESEAGKYLAKEMARNEAESAMIAKLLKGMDAHQAVHAMGVLNGVFVS